MAAAAAATTQKHSHTALLDGETPWPWRTHESENPTQKLSNVTSETLETEQKTCEKLAAAAAATAQKHGHTALPDGETPWPGRTNESENPTQKLSNVTSKTLETEQKARTAAAAAGLQNVPLATPKHHATEGRNDFQKKTLSQGLTSLLDLVKNKATAAAGFQNVPLATPKHHGPEGRTSPRISPKNSLTSRLKP